MDERNPEQRQKEKVEKLKRRRLAVAEHDRQRTEKCRQLGQSLNAQRRPGSMRADEKNKRGDDENADGLTNGGTPRDCAHFRERDDFSGEQYRQIDGSSDRRGDNSHCYKCRGITNRVKPRIE